MFKNFASDNSLKNQSYKSLYNLINKSGPISQADILKQIDITQATLSRMIRELLMNGFIVESGIGMSDGGRPPILYQVNPSCNYIIGIDISRVKTSVVLVDLQLNIVAKKEFTMTINHGPETVINEIKLIINQFLNDFKIGMEELLGIGIGSVGPLDREKGVILNPEMFRDSSWSNVSIIEKLKESFPTLMILENGANTAALAEYETDDLDRNILYCISGAGLRLGMIHNGKVLFNNTGDVSSLSHMTINFEGKKCTCGKLGCLICYISLPNIFEEYCIRKGINNLELKLDYIEIAELIRKDRLIETLVMDSTYYFGIGLANMVNLFYPDKVILNGFLFNEFPSYMEQVIENTKKFLNKGLKNSVSFSSGNLKENATSVGAASMIYNYYFKDNF